MFGNGIGSLNVYVRKEMNTHNTHNTHNRQTHTQHTHTTDTHTHTTHAHRPTHTHTTHTHTHTSGGSLELVSYCRVITPRGAKSCRLL